MKVFAACFVLSFAVISKQEQTFQEVHREWVAEMEPFKPLCLKETSVGDNLVNRAVEHEEYADDSALKCYSRCIYQKLNMINEAGEIIVEGFKSALKLEDGDLAEKVLQECKAIRSEDLCERAYEIAKCVYRVVKTAMANAD